MKTLEVIISHYERQLREAVENGDKLSEEWDYNDSRCLSNHEITQALVANQMLQNTLRRKIDLAKDEKRRRVGESNQRECGVEQSGSSTGP